MVENIRGSFPPSPNGNDNGSSKVENSFAKMLGKDDDKKPNQKHQDNSLKSNTPLLDGIIGGTIEIADHLENVTKPNVEKIKLNIDENIDNIKENVQEVKEDINEKIEEVKDNIQQFKQDIRKTIEEIKDIPQELAGALGDFLVKLGENVDAIDLEKIKNDFKESVKEGAQGVKQFIRNTQEWISKQPQEMIDAIGASLIKLGHNLQDYGEDE